MNTSLRYKKTAGHLESEASDSSVVLLSSGNYYSLEATGAAVWKALGGGPQTLDTLVLAVQKEFEVDSATCREDVASLLEELIGAGLVQEDV